MSSLGAGGAEAGCFHVCNAWAARNDSVTLVPTFSGGGKSFYALDERVELISLSSLVRGHAEFGKRYVARLLALRRLIRERKPDVVISFLPNVNIAALAATAFTRVPCIVCERNDPSNRPLGLIWRMACRSCIASLIWLRCRPRRWLPVFTKFMVACVVSPLSRTLPQDLLQISSCDSPSNQRYTLLSLGRLSEEKQVGQIIESFATLAVKFPLWICIFTERGQYGMN
ncbi:MAG: glycosyltransferase [Betaproteobacteria bacterium]|nr:glycosyltransferase [Betaproteobacteria bacterium]